MSSLPYVLVDVFTQRAFGGNPLAVFPDARGQSPQTMQAIAKEFNLSETSFVFPAAQAGHDYHVRIFTPAVELPTAGHPTLGTAFVLAHEGFIDRHEREHTLTFEEEVGVIPVTLTWQGAALSAIRMCQPLPSFGPPCSERAAIAEMLSLPVSDLEPSLPLEVVSCGIPFLIVPVRTLEAVRAIHFRQDVWERVLRTFATPHVFVFTQQTESVGATTHSRMFAPAMGIAEDPATGAAHGPLACYLVRHGCVKPTMRIEIVGEQGFEIRRPSFIHMTVETEAGQITGVSVGGQCAFMGRGALELSKEEEISLRDSAHYSGMHLD